MFAERRVNNQYKDINDEKNISCFSPGFRIHSQRSEQ
jgi:hypothetical protein